MKKDDFDFSDPAEDRIEYEKRTGLKWEDRFKEKEINEIGLFDRFYGLFIRTLKFFLRIIVGSMAIVAGLVGLITVGYWIYIWWGVISELDFLEFTISAALFFVTIPLSPLYVGINGDWSPAGLIALGLFIFFSFFVLSVRIASKI